MRAVDLIRIKRDGGALTADQIGWLARSYASGEVEDYQMSAWAMAVYLNGMTPEETVALIEAMMHSGEVWDWSEIDGPKVDKHSTGGVGDKVSIILAPLAAACGLKVPMVSGRGLGHTGGTLDKLEAIPGFSTQLGLAGFERLLKEVGVAMGAQTEAFCPTDRKLYALRDVTSTVESIPLITASIMSKKLAEGCEALVLDVKTGNGAFMAKAEDARELARTMVQIGRGMGRKVTALITDMSQPLGRAVGNANEIAESIACLRGAGPDDLMEVVLALTAEMLVLGGVADDEDSARGLLGRAIEDGSALQKLREMIEAQGGEPGVVDDPGRLPQAENHAEICAPSDGFIAGFETREIGVACAMLGAGRARISDKIDPAVGLSVMKKVGEAIGAGEPVFEVAWNDQEKWDAARPLLEKSFRVSGEKVEAGSRILDRVELP